MKSTTLLLTCLLFSLLIISCSEEKNYQPVSYLTEADQQETLRKILPYFAKLPKGYEPANRFDSRLDTFYQSEIKKYSLQHYYKSPEDSFHYFLVTRPAPSLFEKKIGIAGRFKMNSTKEVTEYEESFWTFKMKVPELAEKSAVLFSELVKGNDLSSYLPGKREDEWIEFPDNRVSYDKSSKMWIVGESNRN